MPQQVRTVSDEWPPHSADRMPTLTEVVELEAPLDADALAGGPGAHNMPVSAEALPAPALESVPDTDALVSEVLSELQPRIDMLFESRLREALAPALARAAEGLIREARGELGSALRELVDDAVKRALQRRGGRC